jgi:hypothetical protein
MPMRPVFFGVAVAVALIVVWQWPRTTSHSKAASLRREAVDQAADHTVGPAPVKPPESASAGTSTPNKTVGQHKEEQPTIPKAVAAKMASSYIPTHQRSDPGIMGRIIATRIRWFNEELAEQEPDAEWTKAMQERLEKATSLVPDTHLLSVDCREVTCKVEFIHETELRALDFNDELPSSPITPAFQDDFTSFLERSEDDGQLKNMVFIERDGPGLRQKLSDLLGLDEGEE